MKDITFRVYYGGEPVTNLVQSQVGLKTTAGAIVKNYTTFVNGANGFYVLLGVNTIAEYCSLYIDSVIQPWFGSQLCGDESLLFSTLAGNNPFTGANSFSLPLSVADATADAHALNLKLANSYYIRKTGNVSESINGIKSFTSGIYVPTPVHDLMPVNRAYFNTHLPAFSYMENPNKRRVWYGATQITDELYDTISSAVDSCAGAAIGNRFLIEIGIGLRNTDTSDLVPYVDYKGFSRTATIIQYNHPDNTTSLREIQEISNCKLYFCSGENSPIITKRIYKGHKIHNCDLYSWNDTTFENCDLENVNVCHDSTHNATIKGNCVLKNVFFNREVTKSSFTGFWSGKDNCGNVLIPEGSMPVDPTAPA